MAFLSRAKIKTVKLTVVVIVGYIVCSTPFICVQLWATYGTPSPAVSKAINEDVSLVLSIIVPFS